MYVTLFSVVLLVGLLLLFLPSSVYEKWFEKKTFPIIMRIIGIFLCIGSAISIYTVLSGKIILPLIK